MERLITEVVLAAILLHALTVLPRHWLSLDGTKLGLLSDGAEGRWPRAGAAAFASGVVAMLALGIAWVGWRTGVALPLGIVGYLAMAASGLTLVFGAAFVVGKPAASRVNVGLFLCILATGFGLLAGLLVGRGA